MLTNENGPLWEPSLGLDSSLNASLVHGPHGSPQQQSRGL